MQPVSLFAFASQQAKWLAVRQSAVAGNIANLNTPGYAAKDVEPFEAVLAGTHVSLERTHARHISLGATSEAFEISPVEPDGAALPSENTVDLEEELMKAGEVRRAMEINTGVVKAFHRMLLMTTRT